MARALLVVLLLVFPALSACGPAETATVVEVPPQELPTASATVQIALPPPSVATPVHPGEEWVGTYQCAQGVTDVIVHIDRVTGSAVDARFEFSHSPSGAAGMYEMRGTVQPDGRAHFLPGRWIDQPPGYVTVGMTGQVQGDAFVGRIDNPSCGGFSVRRR